MSCPNRVRITLRAAGGTCPLGVAVMPLTKKQIPKTCPRCGRPDVTVFREEERGKERYSAKCGDCGYQWRLLLLNPGSA